MKRMTLLVACFAAASLMASGCEALNLGGDDLDAGGGGDASSSSGGDASSSSSSGTSSSSGGDASSSSSGGSIPTPDPDEVEAVCADWRVEEGFRVEGSWSGSVSACDAGTLSSDGVDNALRRVNLVRRIAGLPAVSTSPSLNDAAQDCALMMNANLALSHDPPSSWTCYTERGADAAGKSNLASLPGVGAVDLYMVDTGNDTTMGHRRWILSNWLDPIGLGSTSEYSCMYVFEGSGSGDATWTAWPAPGPFPTGLLSDGFYSINDTGWTIQSDGIDLTNAQVEMLEDGEPLSVSVNVLEPFFGSEYAISIVPQGWTAAAGRTYSVVVSGISQAIEYHVHMVDCE